MFDNQLSYDSWNSIIRGRNVKIYHRITDIKIEISNIDNENEYITIKNYIFSVIDTLNLSKTYVAQVNTSTDDKLRKLYEVDPTLFDLKKYNKDLPVYSILCQSKYQPNIYTEKEYDKLSATQKSHATKFWNYTTKSPTYYKCPNEDIPNISFRNDVHPLGYCLPCCRRTNPSKGTNADIVNTVCLSSEGNSSADAETNIVKYILSYGKPLPHKRISEIPDVLAKGIFLNAVDLPYKPFLFGIEQSSPAVPSAGFAYALAFCLSNEDLTAQQVFTKLAEIVLEMETTYYSLGSNGGFVFSSAQDLADTILTSFVTKTSDITPFSPGGLAANSWTNILADLVRHAFGSEIIEIKDNGDNNFSIELFQESITTINSASVGSGLIILFTNQYGTFPMGVTDPKKYLQTDYEEMWMTIRRIFTKSYPEGVITDNIYKGIIENVLSNYNEAKDLPTLAHIKNFIRSQTTYKLDEICVNIRDLCYGVILSEGSKYYIPVKYCTYELDGTLAVYDSRPELLMSHDNVMKIVEAINKYIDTIDEKIRPLQYIKSEILVNKENKNIGFTCRSQYSLICFYHNAIELPIIEIEKIYIPYDTLDIDESISMSLVDNTDDNSVDNIRIKTMWLNLNFNLFVSEFAGIVKTYKNEKIRSKIINYITNTDFNDTNSTNNLRSSLNDLFHDNLVDYYTLKTIISISVTINRNKATETILKYIDNTMFIFDNILIDSLQKKTKAEIVTELKKLMADKVHLLEEYPEEPPDNIYVACHKNPTKQSHCINGKTIVLNDMIESYYDLLATDILNNSKKYIISSLSSGVIDSLSFIHRQNETLNIYISQ